MDGRWRQSGEVHQEAGVERVRCDDAVKVKVKGK